MIRTVFALLFMAVATLAHAESMTLHSTYEVSGTNADGSKYSGTAHVKVISGASFTIHWEVGSSTYDGFGMRNGDALAATYEINGTPGLVIYKVDEEGKWHGIWVVRGKDSGGTENLTPAD
jgi:hypothetical protein